MKQFYLWCKFVGLLVAILGVLLSAYVTAFVMTDFPLPIDLIGPTQWEYPILDWLITGIGLTFCVLGFVYATAEHRTWQNFLYGLPMFIMNAMMLYIWWHMERGLGTDITLASFWLNLFMMANFCAAVLYLFRRFELPPIEV